MRMTRIWCSLLCLVTLVLFAEHGGAQTTNNVAKFSGPVQLPGVSLPAGSYTFALSRDRRTVAVSNAERHIVTLPVMPITRAAGGNIITMRPAVGTAAPEISALYAGGGKEGVEFLYGRVPTAAQDSATTARVQK
jgi:hypothetical protein